MPQQQQSGALTITGMRMWSAHRGDEDTTNAAADAAAALPNISAAPVTVRCQWKAGSNQTNALIAAISDSGKDDTSQSTSTDAVTIDGQQIPNRQFFLLPGLIDSHVHFFDGGRRKTALNLETCDSRAALVAAIRRYIRATLLAAVGGDPEALFTPEEISQLSAWDTTATSHPTKAGTSDNTTTTTPHIPWVVGYQWSDVTLKGLPNKQWLDEACPHVPIMLVRMDCHSCVVNSCALRISGIDAYGPTDPEGGQIDRWEVASVDNTTRSEVENANSNDIPLGEPTGYLREKAIAIVHNVRRATWHVTAKDLDEAYNAASNELLSNGITSCFSMTSLDYDNVKEFEYLMERAGRCNNSTSSTSGCGQQAAGDTTNAEMLVRLRSVVKVEEIEALHAFKRQHFGSGDGNGDNEREQPAHNFGTDYLRFGAVKIFSDGSLGSRTAAMMEPYGDVEGCVGGGDDKDGEHDHGTTKCGGGNGASPKLANSCPCGTLLSSCEDLHSAIQTVAANKLQCCTHAIGDRACKVIQDAYEGCRVDADKGKTAAAMNGGSNSAYAGQSLRFRIEHCQHIASKDEITRYKHTGTIPSVQPCHLLFDGDHMDKRLGAKRVALSYVFRSMLDKGVRPVFGTDWMVAPLCPISNMLAAVHRQPIQFGATAPSTSSDATETDNNAGKGVVSSSSTSPQHQQLPVWNPSEKISVEEALTAYTADAAYGMHMEGLIGRIAVGYFADFAILDGNPFDVLGADESLGGGRPLPNDPSKPSPLQKPRTPIRVAATIVGGKVRYIDDAYKALLVVSKQ